MKNRTNNSAFSRKLFYFLCILLFIFNFLNSCEFISNEEDNEPPIADAGSDIVTLAGSYAILDGSASSLGSGDYNKKYIDWIADANNYECN